jgi:Uri superfamily endonuclease
MTSPESQETRITRLEERLESQRWHVAYLWAATIIMSFVAGSSMIIGIIGISISRTLGKVIETQGQMIQTLTDVVLPH